MNNQTETYLITEAKLTFMTRCSEEWSLLHCVYFLFKWICCNFHPKGKFKILWISWELMINCKLYQKYVKYFIYTKQTFYTNMLWNIPNHRFLVYKYASWQHRSSMLIPVVMIITWHSCSVNHDHDNSSLSEKKTRNRLCLFFCGGGVEEPSLFAEAERRRSLIFSTISLQRPSHYCFNFLESYMELRETRS